MRFALLLVAWSIFSAFLIGVVGHDVVFGGPCSPGLVGPHPSPSIECLAAQSLNDYLMQPSTTAFTAFVLAATIAGGYLVILAAGACRLRGRRHEA